MRATHCYRWISERCYYNLKSLLIPLLRLTARLLVGTTGNLPNHASKNPSATKKVLYRNKSQCCRLSVCIVKAYINVQVWFLTEKMLFMYVSAINISSRQLLNEVGTVSIESSTIPNPLQHMAKYFTPVFKLRGKYAHNREIDHINPPNAQWCKDFENHVNPVMLVCSKKLSVSNFRWIPMCQGFRHSLSRFALYCIGQFPHQQHKG